MTGLKSKSTVHTQLTRMMDEGLIETDHDFGSARALRISDAGWKRLEEQNGEGEAAPAVSQRAQESI